MSVMFAVVKMVAVQMQTFDLIRFFVGVLLVVGSSIATSMGLEIDRVKAVWFEVPSPAFVGVLLVVFPLILAGIRAWKGKEK